MTSHDITGAALPEHAVRELAAATAALVTDHDVIGSVVNVMIGCNQSVGATAAGILMNQPGGERLEFLAATNHRAEHIELYQTQIAEGPGIDCVATGQAVVVDGLTAVADRWPALLDTFRAAGFTGVYAAPMIWHGQVLGALNLFFATDIGDDTAVVAQAFADIASVVVIQAGPTTPTQVLAQTRAALEQRTVIEQAKGVLAYTRGLTMDAAFDQLIELARGQQHPLTKVAGLIVEQASNHQES
jgi:hypothetical protein